MFRTRTLQILPTVRDRLAGCRALVGFDGFVDLIVTPVGLRRSQGEDFSAITTLSEFGQRVLAAAGKSTNIELFPRAEKLGGNGPIMANALLAAGTGVTYVGALGMPQVHPVFAPMAARARAISLCDAAHTTALEFNDGKLLLGTMRSLDDITFERILKVVGEQALHAELEQASLVALVNWTMIPNMTSIFARLARDVLPKLRPASDRIFFFDLADPEKRAVGDLQAALAEIGRFAAFGHVTLGLNLKESQQVAAALGCPAVSDTPTGLQAAATAIRAKLGISTVAIHPRESAACATAGGTCWVPGPVTETPKLTTGAGDHFNAGFTSGQLLGLNPEACLTLGVCFSGHYVRTGESPSLPVIETFLANWR